MNVKSPANFEQHIKIPRIISIPDKKDIKEIDDNLDRLGIEDNISRELREVSSRHFKEKTGFKDISSAVKGNKEWQSRFNDIANDLRILMDDVCGIKRRKYSEEIVEFWKEDTKKRVNNEEY